MKKNTFLVTGSSGFIGTNLSNLLLSKGQRIIMVDMKNPIINLAKYKCIDLYDELTEDWDIMFAKGDIRNCDFLNKVFSRSIDFVVHLAAISTIQAAANNYNETWDINVEGTKNLLMMCCCLSRLKKANPFKGFIYASTDKVYGEGSAKAYTESSPVLPIDSVYDCSKAESDRLVREISEIYKLPSVVLRFCNVYGPFDFQPTRIVPSALKAIEEGRPPLLRMHCDSSGQPKNFGRDLIFVEDLVNAIWLTAQKMDEVRFFAEVFNLGTNHCYPMNEVIKIIQQCANDDSISTIEIVSNSDEIFNQCMSFEKAEYTFGFKPITSLKEGLAKTTEWWKNYKGEKCYAQK